MRELSIDERLELQQLRLREWASTWSTKRSEPVADIAPDESEPLINKSWELTRGVELREWQEAASDKWFDAGREGVIKVVTGAGKTMLALSVIERLQREDSDLHIAIVVPTIVLMNQWYDALLNNSNLAPANIGRVGGGFRESFDTAAERRIVIYVLASARKLLPNLKTSAVTDHLLLVADECHRIEAPEMRRVLSVTRAYSLGLSATPERSDDLAEDAPDDERPLGEIVYELSFADAIDQGILPEFVVEHFGLSLDVKEANRYSTLTRSINETRQRLVSESSTARKVQGGESLMAWARRASSRGGKLASTAAKYVNETTRRKSLLYRAKSRTEATTRLIEQALEERDDARVILFHESIREVVELFDVLQARGIPAVMEHSELPTELRETSLELFRTGAAQVVVSAKSLIEGFNVPEADLGIVVASTSSPRQRIQSMGRVLRSKPATDGGTGTSRICVLYVRDTTDEAIYERADWAELIGLERNNYFKWDPPNPPTEQPGPPRTAVPAEHQINVDSLSVGDRWPGRYEGVEFSAHQNGNITSTDDGIANNPQEIPALIISLKGDGGRFKVTPKTSSILILRPEEDDGWETVFGGRLPEAFDFTAPEIQSDLDVSTLSPGDRYRGPVNDAIELRFRQRRGGTIARRDGGREFYATGKSTKFLVEAIRNLSQSDQQITKFYVNDLGHAFWRDRGEARFIAGSIGELFPSK